MSAIHDFGKSWIAWMARNSVAANLLMFLLLAGGTVSALTIKQEVFPEFTLPWVSISVAYPGASPAEAEEIVTSLEQVVNAVEGVKKITAAASEGYAGVYVELYDDVDENKALADVKSAVDRVTTIPQDAEKPVVSLLANRRQVISLVFYGDVPEAVLRDVAENARNGLKALPDVSEVDIAATRPEEIHVDVAEDTLRQHGLTLEQIAGAVRLGATELPAGGVKTAAGEVLLRTKPKPVHGADFEDIPIKTSPLGAELTVADVATVRDSFAEVDQSATFNGKRAIMLNVYRNADQTPIEVADAVKAFSWQFAAHLPQGVSVTPWMDWSELYRDQASTS
ncbi:MAG: efflux RND transporter permease subunit [Myxococcales bacterium]|nr:efflux RND transporter permease subunit [Myxococcales bacterium]MCB9731168.1 efflux RND transporter permease subunit [Deltaproteobacteria bacterium]